MSKFMCIVKESEPLIDKLRLTVMLTIYARVKNQFSQIIYSVFLSK